MPALARVRLGLVFALLSILFGFGLGAVFGAAEANVKGHLKAEGEAALTTKYGGDRAKMQPVVDKAWAYVQRAHLHGGAMGTVALGLCLLLAALPGASRVRPVAAALSGAGALGYAVFWWLAALRAPGLGSTGAAKESLQWLAVPTSGMAIAGLVIALVLTTRALYGQASRTST